MPQLEKTMTEDLETLEKKIHMGIISQCALTFKRGRWETDVGGVKCVLIVYEQHAEKVFVKPDPVPDWMQEWDENYTPTWHNIYARDYFKQQPHYSLSITIVDTGGERRLCGITSGSGQEHYFLPDSADEYGLFEALDITLNNLDRIIL